MIGWLVISRPFLRVPHRLSKSKLQVIYKVTKRDNKKAKNL